MQPAPGVKVVLHWSICNANLKRRFATHVFRTNLQTCYTCCKFLNRFQNLATRCSTANIATKKNRPQRGYTRTIFRATSHHFKLALHIDKCNTTFRGWRNEDTTLWRNVADVIMFPKCVLAILPRAQHLCPTQILCPGHKKCF